MKWEMSFSVDNKGGSLSCGEWVNMLCIRVGVYLRGSCLSKDTPQETKGWSKLSNFCKLGMLGFINYCMNKMRYIEIWLIDYNVYHSQSFIVTYSGVAAMS